MSSTSPPQLAVPDRLPATAVDTDTTTTTAGRVGERRLAALVNSARAGDHKAWDALVEHFDPVVRGIARSYRLQPGDVDDVVQATWLDLLENVGKIRRPEALPGWLATVTRRRVMRLMQTGAREILTDDACATAGRDDDDPPARLIAAERQAVLSDAVAALPDRPRRVMTVMLADPGIDYLEISALLRVPVGSIGPTRARSLSRLSRNGRLCALHHAERAA